ncbi:hypothetical protein BDR26DRAFT_859785 [Obelidium mucronatum]|nr:hypothetical protein BDR26DRAFT_859785 [Obelidium mucronatum]
MNQQPTETLMLITSFLHPHDAMKLQHMNTRFARFITFDSHFAIQHMHRCCAATSSPVADPDSIELSCINRTYALAFLICFGFTKSVEKLGSHLFMAPLKVALNHRYFDPTMDDNRLIRYAAYNGNAGLTSLLLKHELMDPGVDDDYAIRHASRLGHTEVVRVLADVGANNYCIRLACQKGHVQIVKLLLDSKRVDPSAGQNWALRTASYKGFKEIVDLLLRSELVDPALQVEPPVPGGLGVGGDEDQVGCGAIFSNRFTPRSI